MKRIAGAVLAIATLCSTAQAGGGYYGERRSDGAAIAAGVLNIIGAAIQARNNRYYGPPAYAYGPYEYGPYEANPYNNPYYYRYPGYPGPYNGPYPRYPRERPSLYGEYYGPGPGYGPRHGYGRRDYGRPGYGR
jgi:hypothetical protein